MPTTTLASGSIGLGAPLRRANRLAGNLDHRRAGKGLELFAHPAHPDSKRKQSRGSTLRADERTLEAAATADQPRVRGTEGSPAPLTMGEGLACSAGKKPGSSRPVQHAYDAPLTLPVS